jgi:Plasmid pRiA4b ORF-3-like protein
MSNLVYQFKVTLLGIEPPIWRMMQVPSHYSFWDLHVAIQDAMGWLDYHLHAFSFDKSKSKDIGIPESGRDRSVLAGWEVSLAKHFKVPGERAVYSYDFGDGWQHEVLLEGVLLANSRHVYPRCIDGQRACPPEDSGGIGGYMSLLQVLEAPGSDEYKDTTAWLRDHAKSYLPFRADHFDLNEVRFSDPVERWKTAFSPK